MLARLGAVEGTRITRLPAVATFAWVTPSLVFPALDSIDDRRSLGPEFDEQRESAAAVLRANGWREAAKDSAQFLLAFGVRDRTILVQESHPDPRNERTTVPTCDPNWRATGRRCVEPAPPRYPPVVVPRQATDRRVGFGIVRVRDGATQWWLLHRLGTAEQGPFIARQVLTLLLVEDP